MANGLTITYADLVPFHTDDPNAPNDLTGWAHVLRERENVELLDPVELEERLRDLTPAFSINPERERAYAVELRNELLAAGGRPTRSVRTFDVSEADPESVALYDDNHGLYELYVGEVWYWERELESWKRFLRYRPQSSLKEVDHTTLFTQYLVYQEKRIQDFDVRQKHLKRSGLRPDSQWDRKDLVARLNAIRQQITDIQIEQVDAATELATPSHTISGFPLTSDLNNTRRRSARLANKNGQRSLCSSTALTKDTFRTTREAPAIQSKKTNVSSKTSTSRTLRRSTRLRQQGVIEAQRVKKRSTRKAS